jgi:DNA polymerase III epsilon subunit family exonuclease
VSAPRTLFGDAASAALGDVEFVVLDTETTGLGPVAARVVEIGAVRIRGGREIGRFESLVQPGGPIPPAVTAVHGITDADVAGAPPFEDVAPAFLRFARGATLVAHNAPFDASILAPELARAGFEPPAEAMLCSCRLARKAFREESSHSLGALVRSLGISTTGRHRAMADALAAKEVLLASFAAFPKPPASLAALLERHGPVTRLSDLAQPFARLPESHAALAAAARERGSVAFEYAARAGVFPVRIRARRLFTFERVAYLDALLEGNGAPRTFRVDRIRAESIVAAD